MAKLYHADEETLGSLLGQSTPVLKVPQWQRSYSWGTKEVAAFWEDLMHFSDLHSGKDLEAHEYFLGSIVLVENPTHFEVLDGQQRLATATIFLAAIRDVIKAENASSAEQINTSYICQEDIKSQSPRFALELNNYDNEFFRNAVQQRGTKPPEATLASHKLIEKAYKYLFDQATNVFGAAGAGRDGYDELVRLYEILTDYMSVVAVKSSDPENAAAVFETLNDRGIGLSTLDLLRNFLLMRAKSAKDRDHIVIYWERIFSLGGEGVNAEAFLRHYWVSHYGDVKSRALYREIKKSISEKKTNPVTFSKRLASAAGEYAALVQCTAKDKKLETTLEAVQALNASVLLPALLSGRESVSEKENAKLAFALVSAFVRHTLVGGLAGVALESFTFEMALRLRKTKKVIPEIKLLEAFAPNDAEFKSAFAVTEVPRSKSARYLLTAIEHRLRGTGEMRVEDSRMTHVDHIYPQTPSKTSRWKKHDSLVNRLGNQTLLAAALNTSAKNAGFKKKAPIYKKSDVKITKKLAKSKTWNEEAIDIRQDWLSSFAPQIWAISS